MITKILKALKRSLVRGIDARHQHALFEVANIVSDRYPSDWSLHQIVRDIKENGVR